MPHSVFRCRGMTATLLAAALLAACHRPPPARPAEEPARSGAPEGPGAFDVVKMGGSSDEAGPVYFAHALHADLADPRGDAVPCARCHFPACTPPPARPRRCGSCHLPHDHGPEGGLLPT